MPLVSDEPRAAGDLMPSELAAGDGGALTVQGATSTLKGGMGDSSKDDGAKPIARQPVPAEAEITNINTDGEDQKQAIISILEDWAAWERMLEEQEAEGAEKTTGASLATDMDANTDTNTNQQPLVEEMPAAADPAAALSKANDKTVSQPHTHVSGDGKRNDAVAAEPINESAPSGTSRPTPKRTGVSAGTSNQLLYPSRRERKRAERNDPVARARRQALKVWAADQTRRRSSASEASVSESLRRQGAGSLKEWTAMNSIGSRRSSADATADHNRKGAGTSSESEWFRGKKLPPHVFAPRQVSVQRVNPNIIELGLEPRRSPRRVAVAEQPKQNSHSHPSRANMTAKSPRELGVRPALSIARERGAPTAPPTPRSPAAAALSSTASSSSMVGGRGSPWARSPSRETAGGILVNHCFFYGSSGKTSSPKTMAATKNPSFESKWMRQFREEVSSNPNWWLGSDRFVLGRGAASNPGNVRGGGKGSSGRPSSRSTQALTTQRKRSSSGADRATDLWQEVRSLLAAGRHGAATHAPAGERGHEEGGNGVVYTPSPVDLLSFGDRLRYTPLSQGAWLVGGAASASAAEQQAEDAGLRSEEGSLTIATAAADGSAAAGVDAGGKDGRKEEDGVCEAVSEEGPAVGQTTPGGGNGVRLDASDKASDGGTRKSSRQDLQSIHAATLAKLRGEIDPFTREELVLRAAEEARGALARERARNTPPRRASTELLRPSPQRKRRENVPDSIDYDKVEATLSLIELATRAAGPDAGKQMLQALEGLDKMYQRVSEDKDAAKEERRGFDGMRGAASPQVARAVTIAVADEQSERKESSAAARISSATDGGGGREQGPEAAAQDEASTASPRDSRMLSIAVSSSSSEESAADSEASSVGIIQSIGNWLWSSSSPTRSRRNSEFSDDGHAQQAADELESGHEIGRSEFPAPPERWDVSDSLETHDEARQTVSEDIDNQGDLDEPVERPVSTSDSSQNDNIMPERRSRLLDSEAETFGAERTVLDTTPSEKRGNGCQAEEGVSDVAIGRFGGNGSTFDKQTAQGHNPNRPPISKARRRSEADTPSDSPQLAKDIARAADSLADATNLFRKAPPDCDEDGKLSTREAPASSTGATGDKDPSASGASGKSESNVRATIVSNKDIATELPDVAASGAEQESAREFRYGHDTTGHADPPMPRPLSQAAGFEAEQGGDRAHEFRVHEETDTPGKGAPQEPAVGSAEKGQVDKLVQREGPTTSGEDAAVGKCDRRDDGLGTGDSADPLPHRDSWFSVGTRPRRGNVAGQKQTSVSDFSAADAPSSGGGDKVSGRAPTRVVEAGRDPAANGKRDTSWHKASPEGRWVSPTVYSKFVWPKPGHVCSPKRLRPPGPSGKNKTSPPLIRAPGIVRRSPLIDALHPEVARQREFQQRRRQARRQREEPSPGPTKPEHEHFEDAAESSPEAAAAKSREVERTVKLSTVAGAASTNADSVGTGAKNRRAATTDISTASATVRTPTTIAEDVKARHPHRRYLSETVPLPVPPSPVTKPSRPLLFLAGSGTGGGACGGGFEPHGIAGSAACDAVARAGKLSPLQWEMVETWMARANRSLGPKAWVCLGSSNAFHRTWSRIRKSIAPSEGEYQTPVSPRDRSPPPGTDSQNLGRTVDSEKEKVALDGRRRGRGRQEGEGQPRLHQTRRRATQKRDRAEAKDEPVEEGGQENGQAGSSSSSSSSSSSRSWDQRLSENAAFAVNAAMWTIATERERSTYCAAFDAVQSDAALNREDGDISPAHDATYQQQAARGTGNARSRAAAVEDSNLAATTAALELRVSLAAARSIAIAINININGFVPTAGNTGSRCFGHGGAVVAAPAARHRHDQGPPQSRSLEDRSRFSGGAGGARSSRNETIARRMGVDEVLAESATSLQAMFHKFSRQSARCTRGAIMALPDVLRFCDAFELRPGLVSTREIVDAYKKVAYPGVVGLTDEEIGFSGTKPKPDTIHSKCKDGSPPIREELPHQATSSSANTSCHRDRADEAVPLGDTTIVSSALRNDAVPRDMTLEDLAKTNDVEELATGQGPSQIESSRQHPDGHAMARTERKRGGGAQELADEDTRGDSGITRSIDHKENSTRWAWSRRGTEECSLYFRSDSGCEGHRMPSPSRRSSTASNSDKGCNGGKGGKGKRTVYLGRTQAFPLRRVESSLSVGERGFGLSGVSANAEGGSSRGRGSSNLGSSRSRSNPPSRRTSIARNGGEEGVLTPSVEASGLTEPQFLDWLAIEEERSKQVRERSAILKEEVRRPRDKRAEKKRAATLMTIVACAIGFAEWKTRYQKKKAAIRQAELEELGARSLQRVWRMSRVRRTLAVVRASKPAVRSIVFSMRMKAAAAKEVVARRHRTQAADLIHTALRAGTRTRFRTRISYYIERIVKCQRLVTSYREVTKARERALINKWTRHVHKLDERRFSMYSAHLRDMYNFDPSAVERFLKEMRLLSAQGQTAAQAMKSKLIPLPGIGSTNTNTSTNTRASGEDNDENNEDEERAAAGGTNDADGKRGGAACNPAGIEQPQRLKRVAGERDPGAAQNRITSVSGNAPKRAKVKLAAGWQKRVVHVHSDVEAQASLMCRRGVKHKEISRALRSVLIRDLLDCARREHRNWCWNHVRATREKERQTAIVNMADIRSVLRTDEDEGSRTADEGNGLLEAKIRAQAAQDQGCLPFNRLEYMQLMNMITDDVVMRHPNQHENAAAKEAKAELQAWAKERGLTLPVMRRGSTSKVASYHLHQKALEEQKSEKARQSSSLSSFRGMGGDLDRDTAATSVVEHDDARHRHHGDARMGLRSAVKKTWTRVCGGGGGSERSDKDLKNGIANFYDKSSGVWEDIWGEHMHHGYYVPGNKPKNMKDHRAAQRFMVGRSLEWAGVQEGGAAPKTGVDIGCGVGGSSRQISRRFGTSMTGISLSPVQVERAQALSDAAGLGDKCKFQVADALNTPFESDSFDLVWSMESGEHMPHKPKFVGELARICAPGGHVLVVTWCHRDLEEGETELTPQEEKLLGKINKAFYLPRWCSTADYVKYFEDEGLVDVKRADWTENIQDFWPAVIRSSLSLKGIIGLLKSGPVTIRGAIAMVLMIRGYKKGLVKFALITGKKP
eukprot:g9725.t1